MENFTKRNAVKSKILEHSEAIETLELKHLANYRFIEIYTGIFCNINFRNKLESGDCLLFTSCRLTSCRRIFQSQFTFVFLNFFATSLITSCRPTCVEHWPLGLSSTSNSLLFKGESRLSVLSLDRFFNQFIKLMMVYYQIYFDDIRKKLKKNKLLGLYERAPNVLGLHVLKIKVVTLSVRCNQTTHSFLDFGQGRVGDFVLSQSPSQSQSSSPIPRARHADDTRSFHSL